MIRRIGDNWSKIFEPIAKIFNHTSELREEGSVVISAVLGKGVGVVVKVATSDELSTVVVLSNEEIPSGSVAAWPGLIDRTIPIPTDSASGITPKTKRVEMKEFSSNC